jgi:hypothetical protein
MLVPHRRKDAEFRKGRLAADQAENALILIRLQAVGGNQLGGDGAGIGNGHRGPFGPLEHPGRPRFRQLAGIRQNKEITSGVL